MLVLSRKANQQILFPNLGIKINVMQVKGKLVKIGIDAPEAFTVIRPESTGGPQCEDSHRLRNELNLLQLRIDAIQQRISRGMAIEAEDALNQIFSSTQQLEQELTSNASDAQLPKKKLARLLVVEDSDNERQLMAYVLASQGFDVYVARDGQEALEQLRSWTWKPDVILMDMQMPMFDGLSTLSEIRMDPELSEIPVAAVTGSRHTQDYELEGHSWDAWFAKPINVQQLIEYINSQPLHAK